MSFGDSGFSLWGSFGVSELHHTLFGWCACASCGVVGNSFGKPFCWGMEFGILGGPVRGTYRGGESSFFLGATVLVSPPKFDHGPQVQA